MLFNSQPYVLFLPVVVVSAHVLGRGELLLLCVLEPALPSSDLSHDARELRNRPCPGRLQAKAAGSPRAISGGQFIRPRDLQVPGLA